MGVIKGAMEVALGSETIYSLTTIEHIDEV